MHELRRGHLPVTLQPYSPYTRCHPSFRLPVKRAHATLRYATLGYASVAFNTTLASGPAARPCSRQSFSRPSRRDARTWEASPQNIQQQQ